jgi:DNA mismatch repair protein MSH5
MLQSSGGIASLTASLQVDFTASAEMHRTVVNPGVDAQLDALKRTYDGVEDLLNQTSQAIAGTIPAVYSLDLNVIFFPQIGFLISVPLNPATGRGDYEGSDEEGQRWTRIFSTGTRIYYKDCRMLELDDELGDMYAVICGTLSLCVACVFN